MEERRTMEKAFGEEEEGDGSGGGMQLEFDETQLEVCETLLNLGRLIEKSELASVEKKKESDLREAGRTRVPFTVVWGAKKILVANERRESFARAALASAKTTSTTAAAPSPSQPGKLVQAPSPNTPLSFSPSSESEDNSTPPSQQKRKRPKLTQAVEGLSQIRQQLRKFQIEQEVEKVTIHHNKLLAYNQILREHRERVVSAPCTSQEPEEKSNLKIKNSFNSQVGGVRSGQPYQTAVDDPQPPQRPHLQSQFMVNPPNPTAMVEAQEKLKYHQSPIPAECGQVGQAMAMFPSIRAVMGGAGAGAGVIHMGRLCNNNGTPREEVTGLTATLTQRQSSLNLDYAARAIAATRARLKAAEARRYRKMIMINRQRLPVKSK